LWLIDVSHQGPTNHAELGIQVNGDVLNSTATSKVDKVDHKTSMQRKAVMPVISKALLILSNQQSLQYVKCLMNLCIISKKQVVEHYRATRNCPKNQTPKSKQE
jgi:hypothetical protein